MDRYLNTVIIGGRSTLKKNIQVVFQVIRDTFQEDEINVFKPFKRSNIKNDKDLIIAYHEKRIMDSVESYIMMLKDVFKDSKIKKEVIKDDFYD